MLAIKVFAVSPARPGAERGWAWQEPPAQRRRRMGFSEDTNLWIFWGGSGVRERRVIRLSLALSLNNPHAEDGNPDRAEDF